MRNLQTKKSVALFILIVNFKCYFLLHLGLFESGGVLGGRGVLVSFCNGFV